MMESKDILETDGNQAADKNDDGDKENLNAVARSGANRAVHCDNLLNRADTIAESCGGATSRDNCVEARNRLPNGFCFTSNTIKFRIQGNQGDESQSVEYAKDSNYEKATEDCLRRTQINSHLAVDDSLLSEKRSLNPRHEAPESLTGKGSGADTVDIQSNASFQCEEISEEKFEIDVIFTRQLREVVMKEPPNVPVDFVDMSPRHLPTDPKLTMFCMIPIGHKNPDQKTVILIPHDNADRPYGDEFGATLCTYKDRRKDGTVYYRHFLVDVDPNGPAGQMKISDNDEVVLLNEVFAPELTHKELLETFRAVKVDGQTRFTLVIRRDEKKKKWKWIETSAVLSPDKVVADRPHVEDLIYKPLDSEEIEVPKTKHLYKVPGTQKYLDICNGKVTIGILKGDSSDETKIIWKRAKYWEDDDNTGEIDFAAALCDLSETWYIGIDNQKQIVLQDKPIWFKMIKMGSKIRFQLKGVYLGYDRQSDEVIAEVTQCVFEEFPAPVQGITNFNEMVKEAKQVTEDEFGATSDITSELGSELSSFGDHTSKSNTGSSDLNTGCEISNSDSDRRSIASSISSANFDVRSVASSVSNTDSGTTIASSQTSVDSDRGSTLSSQVSVDDLGDVGNCNNKTADFSLSQSSGTSGYGTEISVEDVEFSPVKDTIVNVFGSKYGDEESSTAK